MAFVYFPNGAIQSNWWPSGEGTDFELNRTLQPLENVKHRLQICSGLDQVNATPGPDGGADILAGRGPLGLDPSYLCVQVKATNEPVDVKVLRELAGTMAAFKASQGLLVSWGGFKLTVLREARQETFKIRLWDQSSLVEAIYRSYEKLPAEIQAELPLKRVWMLVRESEEGDK